MKVIHHPFLLQITLLLSSIHQSTCDDNNNNKNLRHKNSFGLESDFSVSEIGHSHQTILQSLSERMKPKNFFQLADDIHNITTTSSNGKREMIAVPPKQFFHLHHMKSGGTSLNQYLNCALTRATNYYSSQENTKLQLVKSKLSECNYGYFQECTQDPNHTCGKKFAVASYMEYCAPLAVTEQFGWYDADAITMLRNPVDRVWSMYRFQTKACFECKPLTEIYNIMDTQGLNATIGHGVCLAQLSNHITRNLQSSLNTQVDDWSQHDLDEMKVNDALHNLKNRFTVVGLLERLNDTLELFEYALPWLTKELDGSEKICEYPKANSSPRNNRCGEGNTHMELPNVPDEETRKAIEEHNLLDIQVYEEAVQHFEMQLKAMKMGKDYGLS